MDSWYMSIKAELKQFDEEFVKTFPDGSMRWMRSSYAEDVRGWLTQSYKRIQTEAEKEQDEATQAIMDLSRTLTLKEVLDALSITHWGYYEPDKKSLLPRLTEIINKLKT